MLLVMGHTYGNYKPMQDFGPRTDGWDRRIYSSYGAGNIAGKLCRNCSLVPGNTAGSLGACDVERVSGLHKAAWPLC